MPRIETRDRTQLFYVDAGSGAPVVFVASAWLSSGMWEFQFPFLVSHGFRCVACDRRGHPFRAGMERIRLRHAG